MSNDNEMKTCKLRMRRVVMKNKVKVAMGGSLPGFPGEED